MKTFLKYICIAIIFTFIGYENPSITENSKKYIKFYLKKLGLIENFISDSKEVKNLKNNKDLLEKESTEEIEGNSYNMIYKKVLNFDDRTASFYVQPKDNKLSYNIFLQEGLEINNNEIKEMNLPIEITFEKNGGVKSVFKIGDEKFALISAKKSFNCYSGLVFNLRDQNKILETECLPDYKNIDFNGLGGAFTYYKKDLILSLGAPEWNSEEIRNLAQNDKSLLGKTLILNKNLFNKINKKKIENKYHKIFTKGHKNPQGITTLEDIIFSVEHGPQGGDEINILKEGSNYGWPLTSYGTLYNNGKSFLKKDINSLSPIFTFLPSIAPSSIANCPNNLKKYYKENFCIMILTLKDMSLYVALFDKKKLNLISLERFLIGQRLRHFGLSKNNKIFQKNNFFYISVDGEGIYELQFKDFR